MNWRTNEQIEAYSWEPFESVSISSPSPFKGTCDILSYVQTWGRLMQGHEVQNSLVRKKEESKEYLSTFDMFLLTYQVSYRQWRTDGSIYWGGQWESVSLLIKPTQQAKEKTSNPQNIWGYQNTESFWSDMALPAKAIPVLLLNLSV